MMADKCMINLDDKDKNLACPVCNGKTSITDGVPISTVVERWRQERNVDVNHCFHGRKMMWKLECNVCGLGFYNPIFAGDARFYEALVDRFAQANREVSWDYHKTKDYLHSGEIVLEMGSGTGEGLSWLVKETGINGVGYDINPIAVDVAQRAGRPVKLWPSSGSEVINADILCMFQVIEHLSDPVRFLNNALCCLRKGGRVIITVPNSSGYLKWTDELTNLPPYHVTFWNSKSLAALAERCGLNLECLVCQPLMHVHVAGYVEAFLKRTELSAYAKSYPDIVRGIRWRLNRLLSKPNIGKWLHGHSVMVVLKAN